MISDCNHQYQHGLATMTTPVTGPHKNRKEVCLSPTLIYTFPCARKAHSYTLSSFTHSQFRMGSHNSQDHTGPHALWKPVQDSCELTANFGCGRPQDVLPCLVVAAHAFNPRIWRQKQAELCELEASLGLQSEFRVSQADNYTEK